VRGRLNLLVRQRETVVSWRMEKCNNYNNNRPTTVERASNAPIGRHTFDIYDSFTSLNMKIITAIDWLGIKCLHEN